MEHKKKKGDVCHTTLNYKERYKKTTSIKASGKKQQKKCIACSMIGKSGATLFVKGKCSCSEDTKWEKWHNELTNIYKEKYTLLQQPLPEIPIHAKSLSGLVAKTLLQIDSKFYNRENAL